MSLFLVQPNLQLELNGKTNIVYFIKCKGAFELCQQRPFTFSVYFLGLKLFLLRECSKTTVLMLQWQCYKTQAMPPKVI